jgi:tRNA pseudouridine13 synthase
MKLKQIPEDFSVTESWRFDPDPRGEWFVYLMDKQKLSTFEAVERLRASARIPSGDISYCGLKDKHGRRNSSRCAARRWRCRSPTCA